MPSVHEIYLMMNFRERDQLQNLSPLELILIKTDEISTIVTYIKIDKMVFSGV